jgi:hypothetical protein
MTSNNDTAGIFVQLHRPTTGTRLEVLLEMPRRSLDRQLKRGMSHFHRRLRERLGKEYHGFFLCNPPLIHNRPPKAK